MSAMLAMKKGLKNVYVRRALLAGIALLSHCGMFSKNVVMNYSEVERKVRTATCNEPWGASTDLMQEIATATFDQCAHLTAAASLVTHSERQGGVQARRRSHL